MKVLYFQDIGFFTLSLDILEACPLRVIRVKQTTIGRVRPWIGDLEWNYWVILNKVKTTPPCFYSNLSHRLTHWQFSQITDPQLYENLRSFLSLPIFMSQFRFYFCWSSTSWGPCPFKDKCHSFTSVWFCFRFVCLEYILLKAFLHTRVFLLNKEIYSHRFGKSKTGWNFRRNFASLDIRRFPNPLQADRQNYLENKQS